MNDDVWEARPPPQLLLAVALLAILATLDGLTLGQLISSGHRSPQVAGALAIALACGQVAISTIFFTLGHVGFARQGLIMLAAIAYGGGVLAAAATKPIRWDAACGELFILAALVAIPGVIARTMGLRLVHHTAVPMSGARPWQFTLQGGLALLTAAACFFAAIRWITSSPGSGVGVVLEWLLLVSLPWAAFLLVSLPVHPLASLLGVLALITIVAGLSALAATFLNRAAMGLTASVELVLAAALLATLRWAGYEVRLER